MYIDRVHIEDLRCFADATIEFVHPDADQRSALANVTLLLGNNGVGKTTVLRAVALGALHQALFQAGYVPYSMVRRARAGRSPKFGFVESVLVAHRQDFDGKISRGSPRTRWPTKVSLVRRGSVEQIGPVFSDVGNDSALEEQLYADESPGILVLGYGATRRVDPASEFSPGRRRKQRVLRYERVSSLFEEQVTLTPMAAWLPKLERDKPKLHARVCELLDRLIPADTRFTGELDGDEYLFDRGGVKIGFAALSDGYRGYVGLLGDLFHHLCTGLDDDDDPTHSRGIVLIDEIGLHLHPAWQRVVVPTLAKSLPNLQFVFTTHSPIIAGTVYRDNIRLLEADAEGLSRVEPLDEEIHGLNADQVLLTEAFGLASSRSPDFVESFERSTRELDPDNWKDALTLMRMLNHGSAGQAPAELPDAPAWADDAARELVGIIAAEDRPKAASAPTRKKSSVSKKSGTKKSAKKTASKQPKNR